MLYRRVLKSFLLSGLFVAAFATDAHAGQKLGDIILNVIISWDGVADILTTIAWIAGAFLGVAGIFKFKDHVDNPQQTKLSEGVKRMLAGGMMLAFPFMLAAVRGSIFGAAAVGDDHLAFTGYTAAVLTPGGLDEMVVLMISNVAYPIELMLTAFCYLAGTGFILLGISRLTKRMEEGPRGPAGMGTIMTFLTGGVLFSFGDSVGMFSSSLFGDTTLNTNAEIQASVINDPTDRAKIEKTLEGVMLFVTIVGYIAFIRGWFVLRAFADGAQGATMAQGLTFVFGGTLAINLGELVNAIQETLNITGGITFT